MVPHHPISLFLDWDGTITLSDTLSILASIPYTKNPHKNLPPWSQFTSAYTASLASHATTYTPQPPLRKTLHQELTYLESLLLIEQASIQRIEASGIFAHITSADIQAAAEHAAEAQTIPLRRGLGNLLKAVGEGGGHARIVSVSWSGEFIDRFVGLVVGLGIWGEGGGGGAVCANEIVGGPGGRLSRCFEAEGRGIWTAGDKGRVLRGLMREEVSGVGEGGMSVYVGDSVTDLQCLMEVDVGICVRDELLKSEQRALKEVLDRLEIGCRWIGQFGTVPGGEEEMPDSEKKSLWWAGDFQAIVDSPLFTD